MTIKLPKAELAALHKEKATTGVTLTDIVYRWIGPEIKKLKKKHRIRDEDYPPAPTKRKPTGVVSIPIRDFRNEGDDNEEYF